MTHKMGNKLNIFFWMVIFSIGVYYSDFYKTMIDTFWLLVIVFSTLFVGFLISEEGKKTKEAK